MTHTEGETSLSELFKPPFRLIALKQPQPKGEYFMRIVNVDGADLKVKDIRELVHRANSQPDLLKACERALWLLDVMVQHDFLDADYSSKEMIKAAIAKAKPKKAEVKE